MGSTVEVWAAPAELEEDGQIGGVSIRSDG